MSAVAAPAAAMVPTPRPSVDDADAVEVLPGLYVPEAGQWLSTDDRPMIVSASSAGMSR
ncbi:hypothetical protein ABTX62_23290 [Streptomyces sp. NPDC096046]|uniref:hypothetical protein n=1 Tax=Streptomyces sp. NPDC096046 TaxID=3155542 RepID=UPI003320B779